MKKSDHKALMAYQDSCISTILDKTLSVDPQSDSKPAHLLKIANSRLVLQRLGNLDHEQTLLFTEVGTQRSLAHILAYHGRAPDVLRNILKRCPELALVPTANGALPMHIAALKGHVPELLHLINALEEPFIWINKPITSGNYAGKTVLELLVMNIENINIRTFTKAWGQLVLKGADTQATYNEITQSKYFNESLSEANKQHFMTSHQQANNLRNSQEHKIWHAIQQSTPAATIMDMIKNGFWIRMRTVNGSTLFNHAAMFRRIDLLKAFHEVDPTFTQVADNAGRLAIHSAAFLRHVDAVRFLLECDPSTVDSLTHESSMTPFDLAQKGHPKLVGDEHLRDIVDVFDAYSGGTHNEDKSANLTARL